MESGTLKPSPKQPSPHRRQRRAAKPQEREACKRDRSEYGCGYSRIDDIYYNRDRSVTEGGTHQFNLNGFYSLYSRLCEGIVGSTKSEFAAGPVGFKQPHKTVK
jgi:hypothetical protein